MLYEDQSDEVLLLTMVPLFLVALAAVPVFAVPQHDKYHATDRDYGKGDRTIGGVPAAIEEFPFLVHVDIMRRNKVDNITGTLHGCGGAIIGEEWVLTAAHCVDPELPRGCLVQHIDVRAGSSYQDRGGLVRRVTRTVLFTSRLLADKIPPHDIAVIKVDEPWPLDGNTISLARLPRQDDPIPVRERATIMGWGTIDREETEPETLMKQEVVVISHELCNVSWWFRPYTKPVITDKHICTLLHPEESPSFTFKGDSGGPVVVNGEVVGIVSRSSEFRNVPDVHTRVSSYIDWIEEHVGPLPSAE